jgi:prevent-host-death family protein
MATWQLQTAKAKLSELLRAVRDEGPQTISVRGKEEYVVTRKEQSRPATESLALSGEPKTLWDLFEPLRRAGVGDDLDEALRSVREEHENFDHKK